MGTSPTEPFRFSLDLSPIKKKLKMPKGAGLTKPMKLSADLAEVVGKKEASRGECIKQRWAYIKKNNLQDPENKQFFDPDKKMAKVFGTDRIRALVWPSSFPLTCLQLHKVLSIIYVPPHSWTEATSTGPPEQGVLGVQYRLAPPIFHTFRLP